MTKKIIIIAIVVVLVAATIVRLLTNKETTRERVYRYDKEKPVLVQAMRIDPSSDSSEYIFPGTFEPNKETRLSADIQGRVLEVLVDQGSSVKKGQTLVVLDNALLKLQLQGVELQIEGLEADVKRFTILSKADAIQGVQLEKAELGLRSAKVQRATLLEQISKTEIKAPFSGIVTAKLTEAGAFAAPGVPLLQLTDISLLRFTANVAENELKLFGDERKYHLTVDASPETIIVGRLVMTGSKSNMGNSYPVQFLITNTQEQQIKAGMFGKVRISGVTNEKYIVIPASAVAGSNLQPKVYLVKDGKAMLRDITIAGRVQNRVLVSRGVEPGDLLVTNGFINLFDGAHVTIDNAREGE